MCRPTCLPRRPPPPIIPMLGRVRARIVPHCDCADYLAGLASAQKALGSQCEGQVLAEATCFAAALTYGADKLRERDYAAEAGELAECLDKQGDGSAAEALRVLAAELREGR